VKKVGVRHRLQVQVLLKQEENRCASLYYPNCVEVALPPNALRFKPTIC
jgi:hypothetical protein